jgi:hypothetical protein
MELQVTITERISSTQRGAESILGAGHHLILDGISGTVAYAQ